MKTIYLALLALCLLALLGLTLGRRRSVPALILRVLGILAALLLLVAAFLLILPLTEHVSAAPSDSSADWMAALPDEALLTDLAIPGTHDSATLYSELAFFARCQSTTMERQLELGFRYLDIRLRPEGDKLVFCHGFCLCKTGAFPTAPVLDLSTALEPIYAFLDAHPTETVLFTVKSEDQGADLRQFQTLLQEVIDRDAGRWLLTDTVPTLGEARGKLVLLRRYPDAAGLGSAAGIDIGWTEQSFLCEVSEAVAQEQRGELTLFVQDRYKFSVEDKLAALSLGFDTAAEQSGSGALRLNFTSTTTERGLSHPFRIARQINPALPDRMPTGNVGWVVMDFGTAALAEMIYRLNG